MVLARIQLLSRGAQDVYLTGSPRRSLFRTVYHRHTNFAMENIEQVFEKAPTWGSRSSVVISRHGDLVHSFFLRITAPQLTTEDPVSFLRYSNSFCHAFVKRCDLYIGRQKVSTVLGKWLEVQDELSGPEIKRAGYGHAVGKQYFRQMPDDYHESTDQVTYENHMGSKRAVTFFVPIKFHMRSAELCIPLASLRHQDVTIDFEFGSFKDLINWRWGESYELNAAPIPDVTVNDVKVELFATYIYLDGPEKQFFTERRHEYLIEQIQHAEYRTDQKHVKLALPFRHPVKELIWTVSTVSNLDRNVHFDFGEKANTERVTRVQLMLDGEPCMPSIQSKYFRTLVPYQRHTRMPVRHVYCYSFALEPEAVYPTGSCNLSRYRTVEMLMDMKDSDSVIDVYAVSYNMLRVINGTASVAFA